MIRLLFKIFIAYWIAAGIVIVISDVEPHRRIHNPELMDAFEGALSMDARSIAEAYESGHCQQMQKILSDAKDALLLATPDGRLVCGSAAVPGMAKLISTARNTKKRMIENYEWFQLVAFPFRSESGVEYVALFKNGYSSKLHLYGMLPGSTTMIISCMVTLLLGFLMALPIRRLRQAAGQIAMGRLDARVRWRATPLLGAKRGGGDDIDQLVRDFNHMAACLEVLAKSQRALLRDISHALRSPLARLGVGLGLARAASPANMREPLDRIETEAERINALIGQILSLSRLDAIQQPEAASVFSPSELVVDLLPDLQFEAAQRDCSIGTSIADGCRVCGDEELVRTAIENILRNAIKYASGGGSIHVETLAENKNGHRVCSVRVSDNGPGIPENELGLVLEPFYRADRSRHWDQDGFGIGLAIADRAARLHGGTISLRNKPDGGLVVELSFPLVPGVSREPGPAGSLKMSSLP